MCFLRRTRVHNPTANWLVQPFLHSSWQKIPILYNGRSLPPKLPLLMGGSGPHLTHNSFGHSEPRIQMASPSVQPFLHRWPQSVPVLYNGTPLCPLKIAHSHGGFEPPHLTYGSLCPPQSSTKMASRLVQPFSQGSLVWQTNRPIDHAIRMVTIDCIYVRSTGDGISQVAPVCTPPNTCFLGPTQVQIPNRISIGPAVFASAVR